VTPADPHPVPRSGATPDALRERLEELSLDASLEREILAAVAASELRFQEIIEASPLGIHMYRLDADERLIFTGANPAASRILGVDHEQFIGKALEEAFPSIVGTDVPEGYLEVARHGVHWSTEQIIYEDEQIAGAFEVNAFQAGAGAVIAMFRDVGERARSRRALEASEQRFRAIFETCPLGIALVDLETRAIVHANPAMAAMLNYPPSELVGRTVSEITHPEDVHHENQVLGKPEQGDVRSQTLEKRYLRRDGTTMWGRLTTARIPLETEGKYYGVGIVEDITEERRVAEERRRLGERMQQAQKLESLGVLAGGIAHDFNNLLMAILGNADLALQELSRTNPARESLQDIVAGAHRAADLCRQLLAYSGKGRLVVQELNVNEIIEEMLHLVEVSISKKALLRMELAPELPAVRADATQLRQVVLNLITNASESLDERSGVIRVVTGALECDDEYLRDAFVEEPLEPGLYVTLEIADSGCGMDEETRSRIFDPFFTTKFMGRGLGLAAVLGIVRGHRGGIEVSSEPGRGTTFKLLLPASEKPAASLDGPTTALPDWRGEGTVLVVDHDDTVRALAIRMLERLGFEGIGVSDGEEAVEIFREQGARIRCILLDLTMPHMDGETAFRELRRLDGAVPVVLSSGYNAQDIAERFPGKNPSGFLQKPYRLESLASKLQEILG